jgi:hypothetical protein
MQHGSADRRHGRQLLAPDGHARSRMLGPIRQRIERTFGV